jgi:hypothetical protein
VYENNHITKKRLHYEDRKGGTASGIKQKVTEQLRNVGKQKGDAGKSRKQSTVPAPAPQGTGEAQTITTR